MLNKVAVERPKCPICHGTRTRKERTYRGQHEIFAHKSLFVCGDCQMVFAHPLPPADEWDVYNRAFFSESDSRLPESHPAIAFFCEIAGIRLRYIQKYIHPELLPDSVLEIGPGPGYFCLAYLAVQPGARYRAVETDPTCYESLRECGAEVAGSLSELPEMERYGLLVMSHVLEHSIAPRRELAEAARFLEPGGRLFVEVPCRDFEYKPVFDAHVLFFDKPSMGRLLAEVGLAGIRLSYHGESIDQLRRQLSPIGRIRRRLSGLLSRSFPARRTAPRSDVDGQALRDQVEFFQPHLECEKPSRWLRVLAEKPKNRK